MSQLSLCDVIGRCWTGFDFFYEVDFFFITLKNRNTRYGLRRNSKSRNFFFFDLKRIGETRGFSFWFEDFFSFEVEVLLWNERFLMKFFKTFFAFFNYFVVGKKIILKFDNLFTIFFFVFQWILFLNGHYFSISFIRMHWKYFSLKTLEFGIFEHNLW